jgi:hypothetical protein
VTGKAGRDRVPFRSEECAVAIGFQLEVSRETRSCLPFLYTDISRQDTGRGGLFRFILNHSRATATNVYVMLYPKPPLDKVLLDRSELRGRCVAETRSDFRSDADG